MTREMSADAAGVPLPVGLLLLRSLDRLNKKKTRTHLLTRNGEAVVNSGWVYGRAVALAH